MLQHADTETAFDGVLSKAGKGVLVVVDFHATWCGPCHAIAPVFEALSKQYPGVEFVKVDVDKNQPVAKRYSISAMPSFVFLKDSKQLDLLRGADASRLKALVKQYSQDGATGNASAFSGTGNRLGGGSVPSSSGNSLAGFKAPSFNPLVIAALLFFVGPWLYGKLTGATS